MRQNGVGAGWRCLMVIGSASRGRPFMISSITGSDSVLTYLAPAILCAWCFTSTHRERTALQGQVSSVHWAQLTLESMGWCGRKSAVIRRSHRVRALGGKSRWMGMCFQVMSCCFSRIPIWSELGISALQEDCSRRNLPWSGFLLLATGWKMTLLYGLRWAGHRQRTRDFCVLTGYQRVQVWSGSNQRYSGREVKRKAKKERDQGAREE